MDALPATALAVPRSTPPRRRWLAWLAALNRRAGTSAPAATAELAQRLDEAARIWTSHLALAQQQMRDATSQLLQGFALILDQLDAIVAPDRTVGDARLDQRTAVLEQCEAQLRGLIDNFQGFVQSRDQIMGSVRELSGASASLTEMAEDVAKLARHTNLLSLNAAIEAARAGPSGRGFAVVAAEVRRLSAESGETGKRISAQVNRFGERMHEALRQATEHTEHDAGVIQQSQSTINQVVERVDSAVSQLNERATELGSRSEAVRAQVEQLMVAFQFQDRVHQIMDQVGASIAGATAQLQQSLVSGTAPTADEWQALIGAGYTTDEQRAVASGGAAATPQASTSTTFF